MTAYRAGTLTGNTALIREAAAELNTLRLLCDRYADKVERLTAALDEANDRLEAALRELREVTGQ